MLFSFLHIIWTIWKQALGSFNYEDRDEVVGGQDNKIAVIRTFIVLSNLVCAYLIMYNILFK